MIHRHLFRKISFPMNKFAFALLASVAMPISAFAQDAEDPVEEDSEDTVHVDRIVITAPGIEELSVLAGASVVSGEDLTRNQSGQIGEVLDSLPGVATSGFAPGASRPILRGLDGERVRVLRLADGFWTFAYGGRLYRDRLAGAEVVQRPVVETWVFLVPRDDRPAAWLNTAQAGVVPSAPNCGE